MKLSVEANIQILLFFGAGQRTDLRQGIAPRIEKFFKRVAAETVGDDQRFEQYIPIFEYLSRQYAPGWLLLSRLIEERYMISAASKRILDYIRQFIAASEPLSSQREEGWRQLVRVAKAGGDPVTELQGLMELASIPDASIQTVSDAANRVNNLARVPMGSTQALTGLAQDERRLLAHKLLKLSEARINEADATDLSRFAWVALGTGDEAKARDLVARGLALEEDNEYCLRLWEKLSMGEAG